MDILIITKNGLAIRVPAKDFPIQHRGGRGTRSVLLGLDDEVVSAIVIPDIVF